MIFDSYRQYGGLKLSSGCWGNRGFRYESVVAGLRRWRIREGVAVREKGKGEVCLSKISNTKVALVFATYLEPSTNPRRCACGRCCLWIGMILLDLVD